MSELVRLAREALRQQQELDPIHHTIQAGDRIEWQRAGSVQKGLVDFIHVDDTGTRWAFITLGESWAAVNLKYATVIPMSPDALAEWSEDV